MIAIDMNLRRPQRKGRGMAFRRILFVGYGSIGQALTPVLLQQIGYLPEQLQTIAADDFGADDDTPF